jgi:hypothetical protein
MHNENTQVSKSACTECSMLYNNPAKTTQIFPTGVLTSYKSSLKQTLTAFLPSSIPSTGDHHCFLQYLPFTFNKLYYHSNYISMSCLILLCRMQVPEIS